MYHIQVVLNFCFIQTRYNIFIHIRYNIVGDCLTSSVVYEEPRVCEGVYTHALTKLSLFQEREINLMLVSPSQTLNH